MKDIGVIYLPLSQYEFDLGYLELKIQNMLNFLVIRFPKISHFGSKITSYKYFIIQNSDFGNHYEIKFHSIK